MMKMTTTNEWTANAYGTLGVTLIAAAELLFVMWFALYSSGRRSGSIQKY